MAQQIRAEQDAILAANVGDVQRAERDGLNAALLDRLRLDAKSLESIAAAIEDVAALPDPVGEVTGKMDAAQRPPFAQGPCAHWRYRHHL